MLAASVGCDARSGSSSTPSSAAGSLMRRRMRREQREKKQKATSKGGAQLVRHQDSARGDELPVGRPNDGALERVDRGTLRVNLRVRQQREQRGLCEVPLQLVRIDLAFLQLVGPRRGRRRPSETARECQQRRQQRRRGLVLHQ